MRQKQQTPKDIKQIVDLLLKNRGLITNKAQKEFFDPPHPDMISVSELGISDKDLKKAIKRIKTAITNKEKIIVYGDYDVDGVCATAILWETLHSLGANTMPYIPSRFTEGYGLNKESIKELKENDQEIKLIITVDHGIVAHNQVEYAQSLGIDVIITDHHEEGETMPPAFAIVHTVKISGSGVAWALARELDKKPNDHLGLAALGTIADVLPLLGINRSIAVHGLKVLRETPRPGIKALCKQAGIEQEGIDTFHIGFIIGPRLNSMGRVEHALESLRLICTKDRKRAHDLALKLDQTNKLRQEKTEVALDHVQANFGPAWSNGNVPKVLFVHHESYEEGVIGIVAGKLAEKYCRPTIVVSRGEEFSKASARSIPGINIIELLKKAGHDLYKNIGGHKMAAGFTIKTGDLEILGQKLFKVSEQDIKDEDLLRSIRFDCSIGFGNINNDLQIALSKFGPFGYGNPEPTFLTEKAQVRDIKLVGRDRSHIKLRLAQEDGKRVHPAIGFRMGEFYPKISVNLLVDIIYSIEKDDWNGNNILQLKLRDIKNTV